MGNQLLAQSETLLSFLKILIGQAFYYSPFEEYSSGYKPLLLNVSSSSAFNLTIVRLISSHMKKKILSGICHVIKDTF